MKGDPARIQILKAAYRRWKKSQQQPTDDEPQQPDDLPDRPLTLWELEQFLNH